MSGTYQWKAERPPCILPFDPLGREKAHNFKPEKSGEAWQVKIELRDWQEIAVIEEQPAVPQGKGDVK